MRNTCPAALIWIMITTLALMAGCGRTPVPPAQPPPPPPVEDPMPVPAPPPPPQAAPEPLRHQVRAGDTLAAIAHWYTGDPNNWTALARANAAIDPRRMAVGTVVRIPDTLLIRRDPMPPPRRQPAPGKVAPAPPEPAAQEEAPAASQAPVPSPATEELELFGPIEAPRQPAPLELEALP